MSYKLKTVCDICSAENEYRGRVGYIWAHS